MPAAELERDVREERVGPVDRQTVNPVADQVQDGERLAVVVRGDVDDAELEAARVVRGVDHTQAKACGGAGHVDDADLRAVEALIGQIDDADLRAVEGARDVGAARNLEARALIGQVEPGGRLQAAKPSGRDVRARRRLPAPEVSVEDVGAGGDLHALAVAAGDVGAGRDLGPRRQAACDVYPGGELEAAKGAVDLVVAERELRAAEAGGAIGDEPVGESDHIGPAVDGARDEPHLEAGGFVRGSGRGLHCWRAGDRRGGGVVAAARDGHLERRPRMKRRAGQGEVLARRQRQLRLPHRAAVLDRHDVRAGFEAELDAAAGRLAQLGDESAARLAHADASARARASAPGQPAWCARRSPPCRRCPSDRTRRRRAGGRPACARCAPASPARRTETPPAR